MKKTLNSIFLFLLLILGSSLNLQADNWNNNQCWTAETVSLPYSGSGSLSSSDNYDYFQFTLPSPGTLKITVTNATRDIDAYLYNSDCLKNLAYDNANSNNPSITYEYTDTGSTTLKLLLYYPQYTKSTNYNISVTFTPSTPTLSIANVSKNEGNSGTSNMNFTVKLSSSAAATITYATSDVTATAGKDYTATSGTLTFIKGGETTQTISVPIMGDTITENDETFTVTLKSQDTSNSTATATGTIIDDDQVGYTCAKPKTFTKASSYNINGDVLIVGNTNMCYGVNGRCSDPGSARNNDINMIYSKKNDDSTNSAVLNSSSASFQLDPKSTILWAKVYWQGYLVDESTAVKNSARSILFQSPNQSYQTIDSSDFNWVYLASGRFYYQGSADVTSLVKAGGNGYYSVANIVSETGKPIGGSYGGWSLVIIYSNNSKTLKNITVFDGYQGIVTSNDQTSATSYANNNRCSSDTGAKNSMEIPLSGFLTPTAGTVTSSLSVFAGEGDKGATGDHLQLTDNNGTYHYVANALNSYDDIFNSTITYNGTTVTNSTSPVSITPWYSANSNGLDIDTFDVSTDYKDNTLIGNSQTSTTVKLDTNGDGYMPGVFAFSTELYVPDVCYSETVTLNNLPISDSNKPFVGNNLDYEVAITNKNSEPAKGVYIEKVFGEDDGISYVSHSMNIAPIPGTTYPDNNMTDGSGDDTAEFSSNTYTSKFLLGIGASSSSGGTIAYNALTKFKYQAKITNTTIKENSYLVSYRNDQLGISFTGIPIRKCSDFNNSVIAVQPPLGVFNVTNISANVATNDPVDGKDIKNALWSQIAGKDFNVQIVALEDDKATPKNFTGNIILDLVDSTNITDVGTTCTAAPILATFYNPNPKTNFFNNQSLNTLNLKYDKAHQNTRFRIKYYDFSTIAAIEGEQCAVSNTSANINGVPQCFNNMNLVTKYFPQCATPITNVCSSNNQGGDDDWKCYECITGYNVPICSRDNFAIRPESYSIDLNESRLIGGKQYTFDLNATRHANPADDSNVSGYNQTITEDLDKNVSEGLKLPATCINPNLDANRTALTQNITFIEGRNHIANYIFNNIGDVNISVDDSMWTKMDQDEYNGKGYNDCIINNSSNNANANGQIGCNISGDKTFHFFPKAFRNTLALQNFGNGFTYISDDDNMSTHINIATAAILDDNTTITDDDNPIATNYTAQCFARDINTTIELITLPPNNEWLTNDKNATQRIKFFDDNTTTHSEVNATGISRLSTREGNFTDGVANIVINFNFDRNISNPDEPFHIARNDFNITQVIDQNNTTGADFNRTNDHNATFYYGRVYSTDYRDSGIIPTTIRYEVYCKDCNKTAFDINGTQSPTSLTWYQNPLHVIMDGNVTKFSSIGTTLINNVNETTSGAIANGLESNNLSNATAPYTDRIQMTPSSWLLYNLYDANASTNDFTVEFINGGNWAGDGNLGKTVDVNTSSRSNKRIEW